MKSYYVTPKDDDGADSYWVLAKSEASARRLVAINITEAAGATDPTKFDCEIDSTKSPPEGVIFRRLYGPITISKD